MRFMNHWELDLDMLGLENPMNQSPAFMQEAASPLLKIESPALFTVEPTLDYSSTGPAANFAPLAAEAGVSLFMAGAANIGYYDMVSGIGVMSQIGSITAAGHNPIIIDTLSAMELSVLDVLIVQNPSNGDFGLEYLNNFANIEAAVSAGMTLIVGDRFVNGANAILPGGAGISFSGYVYGTDVEVIDDMHPITMGPGGAVTDTSLDGGNSSTHGYADAATLPVGAEIILTTGDPNQVVLFSYSYGAGTVFYTTIPVDYYLAGSGSQSMNDGVMALIANLADYAAGSIEPPNIVELTPNNDRYFGTDAVDIVDALDGNDVLSGGLGDDVLNGMGGNDTFIGSDGGDAFNGGDGIDRVMYSLADSGVTVNFMDVSQNTGQAFGDTYNSIERLFGSSHDDALIMDDGNSFLSGQAGHDYLDGGAGNDSVFGGDGDDWIIGGEGNDLLNGQAGFDTFVFREGDGHDRIIAFEDGVDLIAFQLAASPYFGIGNFAQLDIYQSGSHTVIEYLDDSVTLLNFDASNLSEADFIFMGDV